MEMDKKERSITISYQEITPNGMDTHIWYWSPYMKLLSHHINSVLVEEFYGIKAVTKFKNEFGYGGSKKPKT